MEISLCWWIIESWIEENMDMGLWCLVGLMPYKKKIEGKTTNALLI